MRTYVEWSFWLNAVGIALTVLSLAVSDDIKKRVDGVVRLVLSAPFALWAAYLLWGAA